MRPKGDGRRASGAGSWALVALALAAAGPAAAGDLVGTVRLRGSPPDLPPATVTKDQETCGASVPDLSLRLEAGGVEDAVVTVRGLPPGTPVVARLDQRACRFEPRVQVVPAGSTLEVLNGDPVLHTAHGWRGRQSQFDAPTPERGARVPAKLGKPGIIQVRCDVHSWMRAWIVVADGPATTSARGGSFALRGLPAGTYEVGAWHERLGARTAQVTIPERGEVRLDFTYGE